LVDLIENPSASSWNDAEEEAHLPGINFFCQNTKMRSFRGIKTVEELSSRIAQDTKAPSRLQEALKLSAFTNRHDTWQTHK